MQDQDGQNNTWYNAPLRHTICTSISLLLMLIKRNNHLNFIDKSKFSWQEIKHRLKAGNSCYCPIQTLLSSRLLSRNFKIKIYKTTWSLVLYGCETLSLTLREVIMLGVYENRSLRQIFRPKRDDNGERRMLHNDKLHSLYRSPILVRMIKSTRLRLVTSVK